MESAQSSSPPALPLQPPLVKSAVRPYPSAATPALDHDNLVEGQRAQAPESNLPYQALVANLPCAVYRCVSNELWTAEFVSEGCEQITGYPAAEFMGPPKRSLASLVAPHDWERVRQQIQQAFTHNEAYTLEYRICHADGSERWVAERGGVVLEHSGICRREGLLFNITEQKQTETILAKINQELQESSRLTGAFLGKFTRYQSPLLPSPLLWAAWLIAVLWRMYVNSEWGTRNAEDAAPRPLPLAPEIVNGEL